jgi:hypothetical protein
MQQKLSKQQGNEETQEDTSFILRSKLLVEKPMVISTQCQTGRCNECLEILDQGVKCGHKCHLNTLDVTDTMDQTLKQQQDDQEEFEPITPNKPHIA